MSKIVIITAPKPFVDSHITIIQTNAIRSWKALGKDVEIFMMGDEEGMKEICEEYQLRYFPEVESNEKGIPYIGAMFELAKQNTNAEIITFVNADILLFSDFVNASKIVNNQLSEYLIVGQRWDYQEESLVSTDIDRWEEDYQKKVKTNGQLHQPSGSDYFIFPRHLYNQTPNFTVGRAGWDNWMIYHAVTSPWPAIDASNQIMIVHQNHDYAHLPGGKTHYGLAETSRNQSLGGGKKNMYNLLDVNKFLTENRIKNPKLSWARILRSLERFIHPDEENGLRWKLLLIIQKARRKTIYKIFPIK
jgi:hypothetical protein